MYGASGSVLQIGQEMYVVVDSGLGASGLQAYQRDQY